METVFRHAVVVDRRGRGDIAHVKEEHAWFWISNGGNYHSICIGISWYFFRINENGLQPFLVVQRNFWLVLIYKFGVLCENTLNSSIRYGANIEQNLKSN